MLEKAERCMESKSRLILFAHGSREPRWCAAFQALEAQLQAEKGVDSVRLAYLEFVGPTLADAVGEAARDGVTHLRLLPLFLAAGAHVENDIPELVAAIWHEYPAIRIEVLPIVGQHPAVIAAIYNAALQASR